MRVLNDEAVKSGSRVNAGLGNGVRGNGGDILPIGGRARKRAHVDHADQAPAERQTTRG